MRSIAAAAIASSRDGTFAADGEPDDRSRAEIASLGARGHERQRETALASPRTIARETARLLGYEPIDDPLLRDLDAGTWTGRRLADVAREEPQGVARWLGDPTSAPHGGESIADVVARAAAWLEARRETGGLVCVTHPAIVRAFVVAVLGAPLEAYARIDAQTLHATDLTYDGRRWNLRACNVALR